MDGCCSAHPATTSVSAAEPPLLELDAARPGGTAAVPRWEFEAAAGATIGFFAVREGLQLDFWGYFFEKNDGNIMAK
jgi:hypothetical protein